MDHCQQPYRLPSVIHGLSHGLTKCPPDTSLHQCAHWCRPFKSVHLPEKADCECSRLFLAGALGLEPRAYGFGVSKLFLIVFYCCALSFISCAFSWGITVGILISFHIISQLSRTNNGQQRAEKSRGETIVSPCLFIL